MLSWCLLFFASKGLVHGDLPMPSFMHGDMGGGEDKGKEWKEEKWESNVKMTKPNFSTSGDEKQSHPSQDD